jgi:hypothetical protein
MKWNRKIELHCIDSRRARQCAGIKAPTIPLEYFCFYPIPCPALHCATNSEHQSSFPSLSSSLISSKHSQRSLFIRPTILHLRSCLIGGGTAPEDRTNNKNASKYPCGGAPWSRGVCQSPKNEDSGSRSRGHWV